MENFTLHTITTELTALLVGHRLHRCYQIGTTDLAVDFNLRDHRILVVSTDPKQLALYLTKRTVKQIDNDARLDTSFISLLKKHLGGARLSKVEHLGYDRVVTMFFSGEDENGINYRRELVILLTGRSANILIVENEKIIASLRDRSSEEPIYREPSPAPEKIDPFDCPESKLNEIIAANNGDLMMASRLHLLGFGLQFSEEFATRGQNVAPAPALQNLLEEVFSSPPQPAIYSSVALDVIKNNVGQANFLLTLAPIRFEHCQHQIATRFKTVNEAADIYFTLLDQRKSFQSESRRIESQINSKIKKLTALETNLKREKAGFSQAEHYQRYGELLLANLAQAEKKVDAFIVTDFYDPQQSKIEIPAVNQSSAQEAAEIYFKKARKAKHGLASINSRLPEIENQIFNLKIVLKKLSTLIQPQQLESIKSELGLKTEIKEEKPQQPATAKKKASEKSIPGTRRYRSSDNYEILVGRTSRDNDHLTLRVAKSFDFWFHAADYPGSHVVLRNPKRQPVPQRSIIEAAQLAAKFSQANNVTGARVAVNYCEKKFVTKPKGFGPGQVRLASFKTVMVEPIEAGERIL